MTSATILSDNGVSSGSAGLKSGGGSDGTLLLQTTTAGGAATTAVLIDNAQNVGVQTTPSAWSSFVAVEMGVRGNFVSSYNSGGVYAGSNCYYNGSSWVYKIAGATTGPTLYYGAGGGHTWMAAANGTAGATFSFTQTMSVGKGTTLALEGATSQTGTGVSFPATQSLSSDVNTLDDYEEGTWTPTARGSTSGGTATYSQQVGRYVKIGKMVQIQCYLIWTGGTGTGLMTIGGLPFTADSASGNYALVGGYISDITMTAGNVCYYGVYPNSSVINVDQTPVGGGSATNVPYDASGSLGVTLCYQTA